MASAEVVSRIEGSVDGENDRLSNGHDPGSDHQPSNTNASQASSTSEQPKLSPNNTTTETPDDINLGTHSDLVNGLAEAATNSLNTLLSDSGSYKESVDVFAINNMIQQMTVIDSSPTPQTAPTTSYPGTNWGRYPTADGLGNYSPGGGALYDQYQRPFSGYPANGSAGNQQSAMFSKRPITRQQNQQTQQQQQQSQQQQSQQQQQQPQQQQQIGSLPFNGSGNRPSQPYQPGKFQQQGGWSSPTNGQQQPQQAGFGNGNYQGFSQWGSQQQQGQYGSNQQPGNLQQQQAFRRCTSVPNHMSMRGGYAGSKSVEYSQAIEAGLAENGGQNGASGYAAVQPELGAKNGSPTGVGGSGGSSASPSGQPAGVPGVSDNSNFVSGDLLESLMRTSAEQYKAFTDLQSLGRKGPQQLGLLDENAPYMGEELGASGMPYGDGTSGTGVFGVVPGANGTAASQQQLQMTVAAMGGGQAIGGPGSVVGPGGFNNIQGEKLERFSRKVFVGGLPPDIDEDEIRSSFQQFGALVVDWPHKNESRSYFPPKGYCFLLFQDELSVQLLINVCLQEKGRLFWPVSSPTMKDKMVQIRPWSLTDSDFVMDGQQPIDPRKTIFVGGVPRPLRASELAMIMNDLYGGVCYAGIDVDPELKYPKGAGRVAFSTQQAYIAAISARFVQLRHADIDKRVEVKPYVLDDQMCDECQGQRCSGKFAPFFCANVTCLQYYCEYCWAQIHARPGREFHKPLVKEGADRPRAVPFRWY